MKSKGRDLILEDPFSPTLDPTADLPPKTSRTILESQSPDPALYRPDPAGPAADQDPRVKKVAKSFAEWNPSLIAKRILALSEELSGIEGFKLYKYQREFALRIIRSVLVNDVAELTVLISRQAGKTQAVACVVVALMIILPALARVFPEQLGQFKRGIWIGIFAPRDWQVQTDVDRISAALRAPVTREAMKDPELGGITIVKKLQLSNGSELLAHTASPQTYIESKTLHLLILEECQDMDRMVIQKTLSPMLASTAGTTVRIGTPGTKRSDFLDAIKRNRRRDSTARTGWQYQRHFEYNYEICQQFNPRYKKFIESEKEKYGEDSDAFRMSYKLEWLLERGMFTSPSDMDMLEDRTREALDHFPGQLASAQPHIIAGLDLGKSHDSTVLTLGIVHEDTKSAEGFSHVDVLGWFEFLGDDHETQYHQIVDILREFRVRVMSIDSTGMGDVHSDRYIHNMPSLTTLPVVLSAQMKSQIFKLLDREMRSRRMSYPAGPNTRKMRVYKRFRQQMEDLEKEYKNSYLACHAPKDEIGAHDDYPVSLALMLNSAYAEVMPVVEQTTANLLAAGQTSNWILRG